jgi:hypothetical protein
MGSLDVTRQDPQPIPEIKQFIGAANEAQVFIDDVLSTCLVDTGSMVSTVSSSFLQKNLPDLQIHSLEQLLVVRGPAGNKISYQGYVEVTLAVPLVFRRVTLGDFPLLVVNDTDYNRRVPLLIGMNVISILADIISPDDSTTIHASFRTAVQMSQLSNRHLLKSAGVYGTVKTTQPLKILPERSRVVKCCSQILVPPLKTAALVQQIDVPGVTVTPALVSIKQGTHTVPLELYNYTDEPVRIDQDIMLGQLCQVTISDDKDMSRIFEESRLDSSTHLSDSELRSLKDLLTSYADVFAMSNLDLGCTSVVKHRIDLSDDVPFRERPRRVHPLMLDEVREHLKEMLASGVIRESKSPWCSNVVLVRKPDGSLRFCIDFRGLNRKTIKNAFPMPRIDETLEALAGAQWFTTLDLRSGYWQVEMEETHKERTAFTVGHLGFFECHRMPFGLTGAPATFQHLMETVMGDLNMRKCLVYIDDIVVFSSTFTEHMSRLEEVLERL